MADAPEQRWVLIVGFLVSFATAVAVVAGAFYVEVGTRREESLRREFALERLRDSLEKADLAIKNLSDHLARITRRSDSGFTDPDFSAALERHIERVGGAKFERTGTARERWRRFEKENPTIKIPDFAEP